MIFALLAGEAGAAFIGGAVGDGEAGDASARAMWGLLGQVAVNDWCVHGFINLIGLALCSEKPYATGHAAAMGCNPNAKLGEAEPQFRCLDRHGGGHHLG